MWQGQPFGQETALALTADGILYSLDNKDTKKKTVEICQDKVGQSFEISALQKSARHSAGYRGK